MRYYKAKMTIDTSDIYILTAPADPFARYEHQLVDRYEKLESGSSNVNCIHFPNCNEYTQQKITLLFKHEEIEIRAVTGYVLSGD